jgi:hypothetical protein
MSGFSELRQKINEAKRRLPMPEMLSRLGLSEHAKTTARCPFPGHEDKHPSFSVFKGDDGFWHWKCHSRCGDGDEIMFLSKLKGLSLPMAMNLYLDMAGFPSLRPSKSHEYPKCPESHAFPESPEYPVYPVSEGQRLEQELKGLAGANACTEHDTARKRRWKLAQDLKAVEKRIARQLSPSEVMVAFEEWYRLSLEFLDPEKTHDAYLAAFFAELGKVRVATGEGDTLNKALEAVAKLPEADLPVIPAMPNAPESWRRVAALHCELSERTGGKTYFLTCRDAAKASRGLSHQTAYNINLALALPQLGVIKILSKGKASPNSRKAAEFRYLLPENKNVAEF